MLRLPSPLTVRLAGDQLLCWTPARATRLRVVSGTAWVTRTNDAQDHFLQPGESLWLRRGARVLLGPRDERLDALPACVCVEQPMPRWREAWNGARRRMARWASNPQPERA